MKEGVKLHAGVYRYTCCRPIVQ